MADTKLYKPNHVCIIAEVSANHGQSCQRAVKLIKAAKRCGADAVKFQAYTPDTMTIDVDNRYFRLHHHRWGGQTLYRLYKKAYTPWSWFKKLKRITEDLGMLFFATAYEKTSVDFLESLSVKVHKVASFELNDLPFIRYIAQTRKPLILSTGMATLREMKAAVGVAKRAGAKRIILLKCASGYPARAKDMNLHTITHMRKIFDLPIGLSDHTLGIATSVAAVALGATMIEKHFTLSRHLKTPDSFFSLTPTELEQLVSCVRVAQQSLGKVHYGTLPHEKLSKLVRRSLFAVQAIKKGETFTEDNVRSIRPGSGASPHHIISFLGKKANRTISRGTPLRLNMIRR